MAHPHSHSPAQAPDSSNARRLRWAFIVTAGFMLVEAVGGAISGSLALLADAGHMLTDSAALLFALLAVRFASRYVIPGRKPARKGLGRQASSRW